ncbi:uncharacterized protein N7446_008404 [Penicillium canescens]|uniref:uncharacterized protein n=1 Tax=Penicillium canescens TaxID=5083 RepID=UPI0026E06473|nr:uncharacterized protein N7446_008404 [Penicillium canescens]KAJ6058821.1 hypothetical protein N7446_008404 [Penicillium canescens]
MDELPVPLTVIKRSALSDRKVSSLSLAYPQIPCRSSSLATSVNYESTEAATSTRTPSLSDSLYNIEITKLRPDHTTAARDLATPSPGPIHDKEWVSDRATPARSLELRVLEHFATVPHVNATKVPLEMGASMGPMSQQDFMTDRAQSLSEILHQGAPDLLCPMNLPIAFANMSSYASRPCIEADYMSVWTSVNISVDVNPIALPEASHLAPLDMIILLDCLQQPSPSLLTPIIMASTVLASNLIATYDRLALACVNGRSPNGFDILLPLGFHSAEAAQAALNMFSARQMKKHRRRCPDLANSIQNNCLLPSGFYHSGLPKVLFGSQYRQGHWFSHSLPHPFFPLGTAHPPGWHICSDADEADSDPRNAHFVRKVTKVVRQLRTGISPGAISDLKLSVGPGNGCWFEAAAGSTHLMRLRPGETWIYKLKIGLPLVQYQDTQFTDNSIFKALIAQINDVLREYSPEPALQQVLTAGLEYEHSFLPKSHTVCLETHCTISRTLDMSHKPLCGHEKISTLMAYEDDDDSINISLGSASESS